MNLLTDIINDVAVEVGVNLTAEEKITMQKGILQDIMQRVSWIKHERIAKEGFPWMEKEKAA